MARVKPLLWIIIACLCPAAQAAGEGDDFRLSPNIGPAPKASPKARKKAPARTKKTVKAPRPDTTAINAPVPPTTAAQVFVIEQSAPERVDPDLAQPMQAKISLRAKVPESAKPSVKAADTIKLEPFQPAPDIPMEVFVAWARESEPPAPTQNTLVSQAGSLFATVGQWLRSAVPDTAPAPKQQVAKEESNWLKLPPPAPAADLPMASFLAWAQPDRPVVPEAEIVVALAPASDLPMASFVAWAQAEKPAPEPEIAVELAPANDLPMASFTAWAKASEPPAPEPEIVVERTPASDLPMDSFTAWAEVGEPPAPEPEIVVELEPADELPMDSFTAWAEVGEPPAPEPEIVVEFEPADELSMDSFTDWAQVSEPPVPDPEIVVEVEPADELPMDSFTAWAKVGEPPPPEPEIVMEPAPADELPMESFTEWAGGDQSSPADSAPVKTDTDKTQEISTIPPAQAVGPAADPPVTPRADSLTEDGAAQSTPNIPAPRAPSSETALTEEPAQVRQ